MLKRILILLVLALSQWGCYVDEGGTVYQSTTITTEQRKALEHLKRDLLKIEDIKVGGSPVAAIGRKITANINVRYATTGAIIYDGPAYMYYGMVGSVMIHNNTSKNGILAYNQIGIILGLNGIGVGGKRRITVSPGLVCFNGSIEDASKGPDPSASCPLLRDSRLQHGYVEVRQEPLIVEATLTAACIPTFLHIPSVYSGEFQCRDSGIPQREPNTPIWNIY
jgi:hypothetical protein